MALVMTDKEEDFINKFRKASPEIKASICSIFLGVETWQMAKANERIQSLEKMISEYLDSTGEGAT